MLKARWWRNPVMILKNEQDRGFIFANSLHLLFFSSGCHLLMLTRRQRLSIFAPDFHLNDALDRILIIQYYWNIFKAYWNYEPWLNIYWTCLHLNLIYFAANYNPNLPVWRWLARGCTCILLNQGRDVLLVFCHNNCFALSRGLSIALLCQQHPIVQTIWIGDAACS